MKAVTSIKEAEEFFLLYSPPRMAKEYSLATMRELMKRLDNPQNKLRVVHVAGTSGKTSTAYFIRALLQQAGQTVGLTVSPHIVSIGERAQVNGVLPEKEYVEYVNTFREQIEQWSDLRPSYFELTAAFALWLFAQKQVDYAVVETGLGGLMDASNVITRADKLCVITPIGYDHMEVLGDTLEEIATQKAGIIHTGNQAFISSENSDLSSVFYGSQVHWQQDYDAPKNLPNYQHGNWRLARTVYDAIEKRDSLPHLTDEQLEMAARDTPPGRFEVHTVNGKKVILDGAHNPQKLAAFIASLNKATIQNSQWVISFSEGHDTRISDCLPQIAALHVPAICTEFSVGQDIKSRHSIPADELQKRCGELGMKALDQPNLHEALYMALQTEKNTVIITGSLYLVSAARKLLSIEA